MHWSFFWRAFTPLKYAHWNSPYVWMHMHIDCVHIKLVRLIFLPVVLASWLHSQDRRVSMGSAGSAVPGMDGLAMALWALWNSNTFSAALQKAVNLLGDADTVACRHLPSCSRCGVDTFTAFTCVYGSVRAIASWSQCEPFAVGTWVVSHAFSSQTISYDLLGWCNCWSDGWSTLWLAEDPRRGMEQSMRNMVRVFIRLILAEQFCHFWYFWHLLAVLGYLQ
jgi:putative component of membrane protein insertase Oxa1/YidC/SpoIIIJ protein YidD